MLAGLTWDCFCDWIGKVKDFPAMIMVCLYITYYKMTIAAFYRKGLLGHWQVLSQTVCWIGWLMCAWYTCKMVYWK